MLQRNISGHTLTVMTDPPCEVEAGGELEHDDPIAGFEAVDVSDVNLDKPVSHEAPDPSEGDLPAAPDRPVPDDDEPASEPVAEPAPVEPVAEPAPVEPASPVAAVVNPVEQPATEPAPEPVAPQVVEAPTPAWSAPAAWPATPGGTVTTA